MTISIGANTQNTYLPSLAGLDNLDGTQSTASNLAQTTLNDFGPAVIISFSSQAMDALSSPVDGAIGPSLEPVNLVEVTGHAPEPFDKTATNPTDIENAIATYASGNPQYAQLDNNLNELLAILVEPDVIFTGPDGKVHQQFSKEKVIQAANLIINLKNIAANRNDPAVIGRAYGAIGAINETPLGKAIGAMQAQTGTDLAGLVNFMQNLPAGQGLDYSDNTVLVTGARPPAPAPPPLPPGMDADLWRILNPSPPPLTAENMQVPAYDYDEFVAGHKIHFRLKNLPQGEDLIAINKFKQKIAEIDAIIMQLPPEQRIMLANGTTITAKELQDTWRATEFTINFAGFNGYRNEPGQGEANTDSGHLIAAYNIDKLVEYNKTNYGVGGVEFLILHELAHGTAMGQANNVAAYRGDNHMDTSEYRANEILANDIAKAVALTLGLPPLPNANNGVDKWQRLFTTFYTPSACHSRPAAKLNAADNLVVKSVSSYIPKCGK